MNSFFNKNKRFVDFLAEFNNLNTSDKANKRRLVRLIEKSTEERKLDSINQESASTNSKLNYDYIFLYPSYDLPNLITKIDNRVEQMFAEGLVKETQNVLDLGFTKDSVVLQGTGYKQVIMFINKLIDLQKCIELVKISHRQYAKRQRTWFEGKGRNYKLIKVSNSNEAIEKVNQFLEA